MDSLLHPARFSALQRAEIAEIELTAPVVARLVRSFSALQRAEIAEIIDPLQSDAAPTTRFSALQRAEIAEIVTGASVYLGMGEFQCSSTSRNC